jgi:hypothetical protein
LVDFVKESTGLERIAYPLIINTSHNEVRIYSQLTKDLERDHLFTAQPLVPRLELGSWLSVEDFIIKLQTCYEDTENRNELLKLVSNFVTKDTLEIKDNGIGQEVIVNSGVALQREVEVQPIIRLKPIRTFDEIDQVESLFLFRARKDTSVCIFEADGGSWKNEARKRIVNYLRKSLANEVEAGLVSVI